MRTNYAHQVNPSTNEAEESFGSDEDVEDDENANDVT